MGIQIRGWAIRGLLRHVKLTAADRGGIPALIEASSEPVRTALAQTIRASRWYPYGLYASLLRSFDETFGDRNFGAAVDLGRATLGRDASGVLKILNVFTSVDALVHRGFGAWGNFVWSRHCNRGTPFLVESGLRTATMGLRDFPEIAPEHCHLTTGYLEAMGVAAGGEDMAMERSLVSTAAIRIAPTAVPGADRARIAALTPG